MLRLIFEEVAIFFIPFAAFAIYLIARRRNPLLWESWNEQGFWLAIGGLVLAIVGFVISGVLAPRDIRAFEPTHVEGGRVVPGRFH